MNEIEDMMLDIRDIKFYEEFLAVAAEVAERDKNKKDEHFGIRADEMYDLAPVFFPQVCETFANYKLCSVTAFSLGFGCMNPHLLQAARSHAERRRAALAREDERLRREARQGRRSFWTSVVAAVIAGASLVWNIVFHLL